MRLLRWAPVILCAALAATGCDGASARRYAVTLLEPAKIDCKATARIGEATEGKQLADKFEADWVEHFAGVSPTPVGRELAISEREDSVTAWFDAEIAISIDPFGTPEQVMRGEPHDDYVEAEWVFAEDAGDAERSEALGITPCGELERRVFTLSVTVNGPEIEGRVRRVVRDYRDFGISPCDEVVTCPRDLALTGVEFE